MRVALLGNHLVSYTTESHFVRSLEGLGHQVVELQETNTSTDRIMREAARSALFVWVHTHGVANNGSLSMERVISELRSEKIPCIAFHLDLFYGLRERWKAYSQTTYIRGLDHFFTVDGPMADWLNANTDVKGHYLAPGVLADEAYMAVPTADRFDVGFVGSMRYHKEWPYRPKLIKWLQKTYRDRFRLYGQDAGRVVRGTELNQAYADCKVAIGDSFCPGFDYGPYFSDRLIEAPGRGAFQIVPRVKGIEKCFKEGEEVVLYDFDDFDQLKGLIDHYLQHDEEREKIRLAGHERVRAEHLYIHRWQTILKTVFGEGGLASPTLKSESTEYESRSRRIGALPVPRSGVRVVRRGW